MTSLNSKISIVPIEGCYMFEGHEVLMQHSIQQDGHVRITEIKDGVPGASSVVPYETACEKAEELLSLGYMRY